MDRSYVEKLLANARTRDIQVVHLPQCGEDLHLFTSLTTDEQFRAAAAGGNDEDAAARQVVGLLRFVLVDENGETLLRSFKEASQLISALHPDDLGVLFERLMALAAGDPDTEDPEAGKAS